MAHPFVFAMQGSLSKLDNPGATSKMPQTNPMVIDRSIIINKIEAKNVPHDYNTYIHMYIYISPWLVLNFLTLQRNYICIYIHPDIWLVPFWTIYSFHWYIYAEIHATFLVRIVPPWCSTRIAPEPSRKAYQFSEVERGSFALFNVLKIDLKHSFVKI